MTQIISGMYKGMSARVVEVVGDRVKLEVTVFGRAMPVELPVSEVELDVADPWPRMREEIADDQRMMLQRDEEAFWESILAKPAGDGVEEWLAFEDHRRSVRATASAREAALLSAFERELATLPPDAATARYQEQRSRWLADTELRKGWKEAWRADPESFTAFRDRDEQSRARRHRAELAFEEHAFAEYQRAHADVAISEGGRRDAEALLEGGLREAVAQRLDATWGFLLPDSLCRFWVFLHSLPPKARAVLADLELSPFGVMDLFDRPDATPRDGLDVRLHGRYYRDPPEMLTFMHGGTDGLHFGLWFDDGRNAAGVVSYYNNDGVDLTPPRGTPLEVVRAAVEVAVDRHNQEWSRDSEDLHRKRSFDLRLLREAVMGFETADRPEIGSAYDAKYGAPLRAADREQPDPSRLQTLDGAGAQVDGATQHGSMRRLPRCEAERAVLDDIRKAIGQNDVVVDQWVAEARRRLLAGDAADALCLGRDLHWCAAGNRGREQIAADLLADAYRALGRDSLAEIVTIHGAHRDLAGVDVLGRSPVPA